MRQKKVLRLLRKYIDGHATAEEKAIIDKWYASVAEPDRSSTDDETIKEQLYRRIVVAMNTAATTVPFYKKASYKWAVAASIMLIVGSGAYFFFFNAAEKHTGIVNAPVTQDVAPPAANRAMITLANGQKVFLDSAVNGSIAVQGNIKIVKDADGKVSYQTSPAKREGQMEIYNTLYNPRGSKVIDIALSDGSHVWLNAGSALRFPVAFVGKERKVSIMGEAYFEVVHNKKMPFKVSKGETEVTVMGTHFNVNAYDDESEIKVTLLEGSVKVSIANGQSSMLKPGQQALAAGDLKVVSNINFEQVMAWKNGYFYFEQTDMVTVMRQIGRWYNVDIEYEGKVPDRKFGGEISRSATAMEVLRIFKESKVNFRIEGRKIIVWP